MKCAGLLLVLLLVYLLPAYADGYTLETNLDALDASLSKLEAMLSSTESDMMILRVELTRVSGLLIEARRLSGEQLEAYETLLKRYEKCAESYLLLDGFYRQARTVAIVEGILLVLAFLVILL
jgi:hypothetical protein